MQGIVASLLFVCQDPHPPERVLRVGALVHAEIGAASAGGGTQRAQSASEDAPVLCETFTAVVAEPGVHTLELRSHLFDAYLVLRDGAGAVLAEDDDGAAGVGARIVHTLVPGASYRVEACALHGDGGPFELLLSPGEPSGDAAQAWVEERAALVRDLEIREETLGPDHPGTARALVNLGNLRLSLGELDASEPLYERALVICEEVLGAEHSDTAWAYTNLARLFQDRGEHARARELYEHALAIWEAADPTSLRTASGLCNLATLLSATGDHEGARRVYERALVLHEQAGDAGSLDFGALLNNLGALLQQQGDYATARAMLERSLAICEPQLGPTHPELVLGLNNLAAVLRLLGDYAGARPLAERALAIAEEALGPEHPITASCLSNLATLHLFQGDTSTAFALQERALAMAEKIFGSEHPDVALALANLANLHLLRGDSTSARALHERALAVREKVLGPRHPDTADSLDELARALVTQHELAAARKLFERALAIREEVLGPLHPTTAVSLNDLAILACLEDDPVAARPLFERVTSLREASVGRDHPDSALSRADLALVLAELGRDAEAREQARTAVESCLVHAQRTVWSLSEHERLAFVEQGWRHLRLLLWLSLAAPSVEQERGYELLLAWRGIASRAQLASRERLRAEVPADAPRVLGELQAVQGQISKRLYAPAGADPAADERALRDLRARRNALEVELARLTPPRAEEAVTLAALNASLPPDAAFLDLFEVVGCESRPGGAALREAGWSENRLLAWIVRPGLPLLQLDLGPARAIEDEVKRWLAQMVSTRGVAAGPEREDGARLRELLWDPLAAGLADAELVFVRPDSFLGTLPFEVLPLPGGRFLIEEKGFVYLQTPGDLLRTAVDLAQGRSLLAVGGVDFRSRPVLEETTAASASAGRAAPVALESRSSVTSFWARLTHTEFEAQAVHDLHEHALADAPRLFLSGSAPTEERLKRELPRHGMVHLATHGFFHPAGTVSMGDSAREAAGEPGFGALARETRMLVGELPGLLSGLVCAGANEPAPAGGDDGLLTAEEVLWLDLSGVELVVLSACETALGERRAGEGMLGLRRAFGLAGARTVVSSLWSVKDRSTSELMQHFYENLLLRRQGRAEALRTAQLATLARNRASEQGALPSTWGAFVLSGEWR